MSNTLYIVVPAYNEEEVIRETAERLKIVIENLITQGKISKSSRILFVNDGSKDKTWEMIGELHNNNEVFAGVNLSRNRGHQNALLAGLTVAFPLADITISIDADLQDDIDAIERMVDAYHAGSDIVYGIRKERTTDTFFKRNSAQVFYKLMKALGANIVYNHADYRLLSKRALGVLLEYQETNLFLRGIVPQIGFTTAEVYYDRSERLAGISKYPLKKMLSFAFDGVTSFTIKPIRFVFFVGLLIFLISLIAFVVILIERLTGTPDRGWASIMASIWLLGGIQLLAIGVIGEYIGKSYIETKRRPRFTIEQTLIK